MALAALRTRIPGSTVFICALGLLAAGSWVPRRADAETENFAQLALLHPVQAFPAESSVTGVRLSLLLAVNHDVTGVDIGVAANRTLGDQAGFQVALYNEVSGDLRGTEFGVFLNDVDGELTGLQLCGGANLAAGGRGAQLSVFYNQAKELRGLQLGLVNVAEELDGLQIGLLNINRNGFLPFFPLFNYGF